jgi:hypothetical protein
MYIYRYTLEDVPANLKQVFPNFVCLLLFRPTALDACCY